MLSEGVSENNNGQWDVKDKPSNNGFDGILWSGWGHDEPKEHVNQVNSENCLGVGQTSENM